MNGVRCSSNARTDELWPTESAESQLETGVDLAVFEIGGRRALEIFVLFLSQDITVESEKHHGPTVVAR